MRKIVFLHIEKAAGSSIRDLLYNNFGRDNVYWHGVNEGKSSFLSFPIVGGHKPLTDYSELVKEESLFLAILRDPLDRVISLYNHYIQNSISEMIKSPGFDIGSLENTLKYCVSFQISISNGQCRYVSGSPSFIETLSRVKDSNYVIGLFEELREFEKFISEKIRLSYTSIPKTNVGSEGYKDRVEVTSVSREIIIELTAEDQKLYNYVRDSRSGLYSSLSDPDWSKFVEVLEPLRGFGSSPDYSGKLSCSDFRNELATNEIFRIEVEVVNNSDFEWINSQKDLKISYHWLYEDGSVFDFEGRRFSVESYSIKGKGQYHGIVEVCSPNNEGCYILQLTLLREGFAWLENKGFSPLNIGVVVS